MTLARWCVLAPGWLGHGVDEDRPKSSSEYYLREDKEY